MFAKVKEDLALFLYDNNLVPSGKNLFYAEVEEIDNSKEYMHIEQEEYPNAGSSIIKNANIIRLKNCPQLKFIQHIHLDLL